MARRRLLDLTIIVVHRNGVPLLRECLASIADACPGLTFETIVVDNASSDGSPAMVRAEFPGMALIANKANLGFTRANNQGIRRARGRYVCLLNNDTKCQPGAFAQALRYLDEHPDIGVAGLKLLNRDGSRQLSCRRFPGFSQALFNRYSLLTRLFPRNPYSQQYLMSDLDDNEVRNVDWVSGACMVIRRDLVAKIGGLDRRFFMYSEDVDYCLRAWQAGTRVAYVPVGEIFHYIGQTSSKFPFMPIVERHRSMYRFYKKHYSRELLFLDAATAAMVAVRCAAQLAVAAVKRRGAAA